MTKKDLFRILLKIFGVINFFTFIVFYTVQLVLSFFYGENEPMYLIINILSLVIAYAFFHLTIFKPDVVLHFFKLDKGFDTETIDFKELNLKQLLQTGLLLFSLYILIFTLPTVIYEGLKLFKQSIETKPVNLFQSPTTYVDNSFFYIDCIKLGLAFLILTNYKTISDRILRINAKNDIPTTEL